MNKEITLRLILVLLMVLPASHIMAQGEISQLGTIDVIMQDDGYIEISGMQLVFNSADVEVTYRGNSVLSSFLSPGMRVTYRTRSDGSISEITLIGPASLLEQINNH